MGDLTAHFSRKEFVCPDCGWMEPDEKLVAALEKLRMLAGVPIWITSGCRCAVWNRRVGGKPKSQHLVGKAADIVIQGAYPHEAAKMAEMIDDFKNGGIGIYPTRGFIHVDVRDKVARWVG